jgi:hypothetical protein
MASRSSDQLHNNGMHDQPEQGRSQAAYLEIARQIARETLKADRQALELYTWATSAPAAGGSV